MEPQIIDYYNEIPHGINVIDKMNEELEELQKKYDALEKKINKFRDPYIVVDTIEEYKNYDDIISNQFKQKIKDFLHNEETGLLAIINEYEYDENRIEGPWSIYEIFSQSWWKNYQCANKEETCKEHIINELDDITNNKNKEWCELRIDVAFEHCLEQYLEHSHERIDDEIIDDLIHHIYNDENNDFLPRSYIDTCSEHSSLGCCGCLYDLVSYKCKKCGMFDYGNDNLLCWECE